MKKKTTIKFINEAQLVHGDKYDYSITEYINSTTKVTITCLQHGEFDQIPRSHTSGSGCPACSNNNIQKTTEDFIKDARNIHGDKYDYSELQYTNVKTRLKIICKKHGEFIQLPGNHLKGYGCPECGLVTNADLRRRTNEEFAVDAHPKHNK